jgi:hypothetical protein
VIGMGDGVEGWQRSVWLPLLMALPLMGCGGGFGTSLDPPPASDPAPTGYSVTAALAQLASGFPAVALPAPPFWSTHTTVNSSAALSAALVTGAKRIACTPGSTFTQPVTIHQPDTLLVMDDCTIGDGAGSRILNINADRVKVEGGTWTGGFAIDQHSDVHLYNVSFTGLAQGSLNEVMYASRVLIERSTLRQNTPPPGAVVLWSQQSADLVIADSQVHQTVPDVQATIRTHGAKVVVMDSYITNPTHHVLRAHADGTIASPAVAWVRNLTQGGRIQAWGGPGDPLQVDRMWIVDNEFHFNATGFFINYPSITVGVTTGNRVYDGDGGFVWGSYSGWTVSGNSSFPYQDAGLWNGTGNPR